MNIKVGFLGRLLVILISIIFFIWPLLLAPNANGFYEMILWIGIIQVFLVLLITLYFILSIIRWTVEYLIKGEIN